MGCFNGVQLYKPTRAIDRIVVLLIVVACVAQSLQAQNSASLRGVIRDSSGKPVAGVIIQLKGKESAQTQTVHSDSQGTYSFATVQGGVYSLRAEMTGYSVAEIASVFLAPNEEKHVDLNLAPQSASSQGSPSQQPEFFDQPSFTVAGVTDTTSLGGHGSDTVVRTRETLAKETVTLGKTAGSENRSASDAEKTLRANAEREPASFESNYRLGKALVENGEAGEAIVYLERARTLKPELRERLPSGVGQCAIGKLRECTQSDVGITAAIRQGRTPSSAGRCPGTNGRFSGCGARVPTGC